MNIEISDIDWQRIQETHQEEADRNSKRPGWLDASDVAAEMVRLWIEDHSA